MVKTFVQTVALISVLGVILYATGLISEEMAKETMFGLLLAAIPLIGGVMIYLAAKGNLMQNKELLITGVATLILGTTYLLGDILFFGYSVKQFGIVVGVGTEIVLIFMLLANWQYK